MTLLIAPIGGDPRLEPALAALAAFYPGAGDGDGPTAPLRLDLHEEPEGPDAPHPLERALRDALTEAAARETPLCIALVAAFDDNARDRIGEVFHRATETLGRAFATLARAGQVAGDGHHPARRHVRIVPWIFADAPPDAWPADCFHLDMRLSLHALTPILHTGLLASGADRGWDPWGHARLLTDMLTLQAASTDAGLLARLLPRGDDGRPRSLVLRSALVDCPETDHQRLLLLDHLRSRQREDDVPLLLDPADLDRRVADHRQADSAANRTARQRLQPILDRLDDRISPDDYLFHDGRGGAPAHGAELPTRRVGPSVDGVWPWPRYAPGGWPAWNPPSTLLHARQAAEDHIRHLENRVLGRLQADALSEVRELVASAETGMRTDLDTHLTRSDGPGDGVASAIAWLHGIEGMLEDVQTRADPAPEDDGGVPRLVEKWRAGERRLMEAGTDIPSLASAFLPPALIVLAAVSVAAATWWTVFGPAIALVPGFGLAGLLAWHQKRRIRAHLDAWSSFRATMLAEANTLIKRRIDHINRQVRAVRRAAVRDLGTIARGLRERIQLEARGLARMIVDERERIRSHEAEGRALQAREGSGYYLTEFADESALHVDRATLTRGVAERLRGVFGTDRRLQPVAIEQWEALLTALDQASRRAHNEREKALLDEALQRASERVRDPGHEPAVLARPAFDSTDHFLVLVGPTMERLLGSRRVGEALAATLRAGELAPDIHLAPRMPAGVTTLTWRRVSTVQPAPARNAADAPRHASSSQGGA